MVGQSVFKFSALFVAISLAMSMIEVHAAEVVDDESSVALTQVVVTAKRQNPTSEHTKAYTVKKSSSATKMDMSLKETPQTVNVMTRQQMDDFGLNSARSALALSSGVVVQNQETDRTSYASRGSEISNFQVDGVGIPYDGYNYQSGDIDTYLYDRIDVVKGANGLISSLGDPGATVNFIRKRPTSDVQASGGISYGSWNTKRVEGDISGKLNDSGSVRGRLTAAAEKGNSYLDHYSHQKTLFSGVLEADLTDSTLLTLGHYEQRNQPQGNNWGALPLLNTSGQQLSYARSTNPVPDWVKWDKSTKNSFIELKQKFIGDWELKGSFSHIQNQENSALVYYYGAPDTNGPGVGILPSLYDGKESQQLADINLKGTYPLFGQRHDLVLGYSWSKDVQKQTSAYTADAPTFDWYTWDGQFAMPSFSYGNTAGTTADYHTMLRSVYVATRLHLTDDLRLLVGLNHTEADSSGNNYGAPMDYHRSKSMPYAGITYNLTPNYTVYTSYSTIFRPQSQLDTSGQMIAPIEGKAYEAGVKGSWLNNRLTGSVALFKTRQDNYPLRASDSASIIKRYFVGDLESQGFEVNLAGKITDDINLIAGYTQVRMIDALTDIRTRTYLPNRMFNLLTTYQFPQLPALKVGAGVSWQDKTSQDITGTAYIGSTVVPYAGTIRQGSYALLNLMTSYDINSHVKVQFNGANVTNKKYLNSFPDGSGYYGAPANYTLSLKFNY